MDLGGTHNDRDLNDDDEAGYMDLGRGNGDDDDFDETGYMDM